jgi:hypothetical protein
LRKPRNLLLPDEGYVFAVRERVSGSLHLPFTCHFRRDGGTFGSGGSLLAQTFKVKKFFPTLPKPGSWSSKVCRRG